MKLRYTLLLLVIAILVVGSGFQLSAQVTKGKTIKAADPFVGTWKMNLEKSKSPAGQAPKSFTVKVQVSGNTMKSVIDAVLSDGKPQHAEETRIQDGKDHAISGHPEYDTYMEKRVDSHTIVATQKKDGKEVSSNRLEVSKDGKTVTFTAKQKDPTGQDVNIITVLDKQ